MKSNLLSRTFAVTAVAGMALTLSACGSDDSSDTASTSSAAEPTSESSSAAPTTTEASAAPVGENFGSGCAAVPTDGAGSFAGMATAPVATAASANPVLSTLVTAVGVAGLGDTLNTTDNLTVLAPANPAFEAIPADALNAALADVPGLTKILTHHVISGRLTPEELAGTHTTLNGDDVTIEGSGEAFTVAGTGTLTGTAANVICGNVQTANATVYIIDQVLKPTA